MIAVSSSDSQSSEFGQRICAVDELVDGCGKTAKRWKHHPQACIIFSRSYHVIILFYSRTAVVVVARKFAPTRCLRL